MYSNSSILRAARAVAVALTTADCASAPVAGPSPYPTVTGSAGELTRITSDPLFEWNPRPSPNGKMLLMQQRDDAKSGDARFSIVRLDIGSPGRTLVSDIGAGGAAWFPDNRYFAYYTTRTGVGRIVRSTAAGGGGGMTFLTASPSGDGEGNPDVSSDGKRVAFVMNLTRDSIAKGKVVGKAPAPVIAVIEIGSSSVTMYGAGTLPRWAPNGTTIAFQTPDRGKEQLFSMEAGGGGQLTQLTSGAAFNIHPSWSPDGNWIAFISNRDGGQHLYIMKADGTQVTQLTSGKSIEGTPAWSSDGFIYFASNASGNYDIWRLKPIL